MSKNIQELTDKELAEEIARRTQVKREAVKKFREEADQRTMQNIDTLIELSTHDRLSCDDNTYENVESGCPRCRLLAAKKEQYWDDTFGVEIRVCRRVPLEEIKFELP